MSDGVLEDVFQTLFKNPGSSIDGLSQVLKLGGVTRGEVCAAVLKLKRMKRAVAYASDEKRVYYKPWVALYPPAADDKGESDGEQVSGAVETGGASPGEDRKEACSVEQLQRVLAETKARHRRALHGLLGVFSDVLSEHMAE